MSVEINYYILVQEESGEFRDYNYILYGDVDSAEQAYNEYLKKFPDKKFKLIEKVITTYVEYQTVRSNDSN